MPTETDIASKLSPFISPEQKPYLQGFAKAIASIIHNPEVNQQLPQTSELHTQFEKMLLALAGKEIRTEDRVISFGQGNQIGDIHIDNVAGGNITNIENLYFSIKESASEQEKAEQLLETFLDPLEAIFAQTKKIHDELVGEYADLEYGPQQLRAYFESLPPTNRLKVSWYRKIQRLHNYNQEALNLIIKYRAYASEEFRKATDSFRYHIEDWEDLWKSIENTTVLDTYTEPTPATPLSYETSIRGQARAEPFPPELDTILTNEIKSVRARTQH